MAEKIVSPGVFTQENDLSFVPQGISEIGAAIIGPTVKGPAFVPTILQSFEDYEEMFGGLSEDTYIPYTVKEYLKNAGTVTVVRVLDMGGYSVTPLGIKASSGDGNAAAYATGSITFLGTFGTVVDDEVQITIDSTEYRFIAADPAGGGVPADSSPIFFLATGSSIANYVTQLVAKVDAQSIGVDTTAATADFQLTASTAGTSGNSISVDTGSASTFSDVLTLQGGLADTSTVSSLVSVIHPSENSNAIGGTFSKTTNAAVASAEKSYNTLNFVLSGSADTAGTTVSCSLNPAKDNFIANIFGDTPKASKKGYLYLNFRQFLSSSANTLKSGSFVKAVTLDVNGGTGGSDTSPRYSAASTPTIVSQHIGAPVSIYGSLSTSDLFTVYHRAHGTSTNKDLKITISNVKFASEVPNSDYGSFTLNVRKWDDSDKRPVSIETWTNLNINPDSPNYFARVIGDQYVTIDSAGKLIKNGDYPNGSKYIYVTPDAAVNNGSVAKGLVPFGHATIKQPVGTDFGNLPTASLKISQTDTGQLGGTYNKNFNYGFDWANITTANDNINYLMPLDESSPVAGNNKVFNLSTLKVHPSASTGAGIGLSSSASPINARKFSIPFQGGFDGINPATSKNTGTAITNTNTMGFDVSTGTATGTKSYKKALASVSNQDEFDINMILTPGIISRLSSAVAQKAIDVCEDRGDCFYIMDSVGVTDTISTATTEADSWDSSYSATYYPWMKYRDTNLNKYIWVPPSVLLPAVFAFNDQIAAEWYAPAGLNRGGITNATDVYTRLTHDERDDLYEGRVNPIAIFPGQGITAWGQKTLQSKATALDRINVRRLLINLKKFVASTSRYLVFEQNTTATRNRFLSTVNPYLESVQQRQGLYAFKVVMDETNNTPDIIDRNILKGAIYLQPAKTAEFIVVDFNIMPTGASFED